MSQIGFTVPAAVYDTPSRSGTILETVGGPGDPTLLTFVSTFTNSEGTWTQVEIPGWGSDMMGNPIAQAGYILSAEVAASGGTIVPISTVGDTSTPIGTIYASGLAQITNSLGLPATIAGIPTLALVIGGALIGFVWLTHRPSVIVERRG